MGDKTQNICRICLVENNEELQCVFDTIKCTVEPKQLSEMLMAFAKVEIFLGDELPDQICFNCAQNTIKLYLFKIKCEESDTILRNRFREDPFIVNDKIEIERVDILDKLKLEIKSENVEEADDVLKDSSGLIENNHLETNFYEDYDACAAQKHNESLITLNNKTTTNSTLSITEKKFESKENNALICTKVAEIAHTKKSLSAVEKLYECDVCKKKFTQSCNLATHKRIHTGEKLHKCDICEKKFIHSGTLASHKRTHTGEKPYKCDVCGKTFIQSCNLKAHKRTHTGEKPYKCDVCENKFTKLYNLAAHKRIHTGEKPYKCDVCEKKFIQLSVLASHKRTHTGEKPYKCDMCEMTFIQSCNLSGHKRTAHTGQKS